MQASEDEDWNPMLKFVINTDLKNDFLALNGISTELLYILLSLVTQSSELKYDFDLLKWFQQHQIY